MPPFSSSEQVFAPDGPLGKAFEHYEQRTGQLAMAQAVERALLHEKVLFCEAGTGTGKTLAYLIPALLSGKKVIISTATHALQEQIFHKDLVLLERALGRTISVALMKGLANYLCLRRFDEFRNSAQSGDPKWSGKLRVIERWEQETERGDLSELSGFKDDDEVLSQLNSSSDTRVGPRCSHFANCYVTRMRQNAENAQIVLVNHHLFFADLALRGPHPGRVLPEYDAVIFDEAHQLENVASLFFGVRVSRRRIKNITGEASRLLAGSGEALMSTSPLQVENATEQLFAALGKLRQLSEPRAALERDIWTGPLYQKYLALDTALEGLENSANVVRGKLTNNGTRAPQADLVDGLESIIRRCQDLRNGLNTVVDGAPGRVSWFDTEGHGSALSSTPIDLSDTLREAVFNRIPSVVLTSATLAAATPSNADDSNTSVFNFVRTRLGAIDCIAEVEELQVPSPFDFKNHSLLYLPRDLPDPATQEFRAQALERIAELVEASDGGAFVLTTSLRSLRWLQAGLKPMLGERLLLMQGTAPKQALLSAFQSSHRAVLLATMGFWEGVDVPGNALRLVILEKIPFSVPTDPIMRARAQALEEQQKNPFNELFLPLAQMHLKQGFGRLIRGEHDRGVVALLDSRIHSRGYGQRLLSQLPDARRVVDLAAVESFLRGLRPQA